MKGTPVGALAIALSQDRILERGHSKHERSFGREYSQLSERSLPEAQLRAQSALPMHPATQQACGMHMGFKRLGPLCRVWWRVASCG